MEDRKWQDIGLLVLRVGVGIMFIVHGWPKLMGGPEKWAYIGGEMAGFAFVPAFWGFMAAFAECVGGVALIVGLLTRPFAILMFITMLVAAATHLKAGDGIKGAAQAIELGIVFLSLVLAGPGKFSLRQMIDPFKRKWFV